MMLYNKLCPYCSVRMVKAENQANSRSVEHLIPKTLLRCKPKNDAAPSFQAFKFSSVAMGHHYLPRRLLRGFSRQDAVFMWDKQQAVPLRSLLTKSVANEPGMYSDELENRLNNEVEQPFNSILDRVDQGQAIEQSDAETIARYVTTSIRRVPAGRARSDGHLPAVADQLLALHFSLIEAAQDLTDDQKSSACAAISDRLTTIKGGDQDWLWHETVLPEMLPRLTSAFKSMKWHQCKAPAGQQFLIGDDPVLLDKVNGISHNKAFVALPVRSDVVLIGGWRDRWHQSVLPVTPAQVRRINHLTVTQANRWVFFKDKSPWLEPFLQKYTRKP